MKTTIRSIMSHIKVLEETKTKHASNLESAINYWKKELKNKLKQTKIKINN